MSIKYVVTLESQKYYKILISIEVIMYVTYHVFYHSRMKLLFSFLGYNILDNMA